MTGRAARSTSKADEKFATEQKKQVVRKRRAKTVKTEKEDRRSKRTRQLVSSALVDLMLEKQFDAITVQDILDRANVGRSTFYAHYTDKEDLLISEIARVIHQLEAYAPGLEH